MASEPVTRAVMHKDGECHGYEDEPCDISNQPVTELIERGAEFRIAAEMVLEYIVVDARIHPDKENRWNEMVSELAAKLKEVGDGR